MSESSSAAPPPRPIAFHLLLPSPDGSAVLVEERAGEEQPPAYERLLDPGQLAIEAVRHVLDELGLADVPVLETHVPRTPETEASTEPRAALAVCEAAPAGWQPPAGTRWLALDEPPPAAPDVLRPRLETWLAEWRTAAAPPALRPRWSRPGWHVRATDWIARTLEDAGRPLDGEIEVRRLWGISVLMHARTKGGGPVWFKAVFPPFGHEPAVTAALRGLFPARVPNVIGYEPTEGWLLLDHVAAAPADEQSTTAAERDGDGGGADASTADASTADGGGVDGGTADGFADADDHPQGLPSLAVLTAGIRALVEIQCGLVDRTEDFVALGCPRRGLEAVAADLERATGGAAPLPGVTLPPERIAHLVEWVRERAEWLAGLGIPDVVLHGDFHTGNLIAGPDGPVIIDWSDAAIGHPLMDVGAFLDEIDDPLRTVLWHTWLDALAPLGPVDQLRDELETVQALAAAYQVESYAHIVRNLEPLNQYQLSGGLGHFLAQVDARVPR